MKAQSPTTRISWISLRPSILRHRRTGRRPQGRGEFLLAEGWLSRHQEHHVVGHQREDGVDVARPGRRHPGGDEVADLLLVGAGHADQFFFFGGSLGAGTATANGALTAFTGPDALNCTTSDETTA